MTTDPSLGWEAVAHQFVRIRSSVGAALVRSWARKNLAAKARIIDIGCGSGVPVAQALASEGYEVFGIDASPSLAAAFERNLPGCPVRCEAMQETDFFGLTFDAAVAIGLLFLLDPDDRKRLITKVAGALRPRGRFLFSAPRVICEWQDTLTGRRSVSLGEATYVQLLEAAGFRLGAFQMDEGGNSYFDGELIR